MLSRDREVALSTRVARMVAWVNMMRSGCFLAKAKNVLELFLIHAVYIQIKGVKFRSGGISFLVEKQSSDFMLGLIDNHTMVCVWVSGQKVAGGKTVFIVVRMSGGVGIPESGCRVQSLIK